MSEPLPLFLYPLRKHSRQYANRLELIERNMEGFSARSLRLCRQVFLAFLILRDLADASAKSYLVHYVELLRVDNEVARNWYLQEEVFT